MARSVGRHGLEAERSHHRDEESENAGTFDRDSELELWTRAGHIKVKLAKGVDVRRFDNLIAWAVLHAG